MSRSIISKFLSKQIFENFSAVFIILCLLVFINQFILVAKDSIKIGLLHSEVLNFVLFKTIRDVPIIFIFSFFAGYLITLNKLNKNSEKIILKFSGMSNLDMFNAAKKIIIIAVFFTFLSSSFLTPIINEKLVTIKKITGNRPDYIFFQEREFSNFGDYILYSEVVNSDEENQMLDNVYIFSNNPDGKVIYAQKGMRFFSNSKIYLELSDGSIYDSKVDNTSVTNFKKYLLEIYSPNKILDSDEDILGLDSINTLELLFYGTYDSFKEIGYRISLPIMLILLLFIAPFLIPIGNRNAKDNSIIFGLTLFIIYINLVNIAKETSIDNLLEAIIVSIAAHLVFIMLLVIFSNKSLNR